MKKFYRSSKLLLLILILIAGCKEESGRVPPSISFVYEQGFTDSALVVKTGTNLRVHIMANSGDAALTNLVVSMSAPGGNTKALDSGIYTRHLDYTGSIQFGGEAYERWTFMVRDKNGMTASCSLTLTRDSSSQFGEIRSFHSLKIGLQDNPDFGNFLEPLTGNIIPEDSAATRQKDIYILAYLGDILSPPTGITLSSPNESDAPTFYKTLISWTSPKNETRYNQDLNSITAAEFDACTNDSLIIFNYTSATAGKRKFKMLKAGDIIPFRITAGSLAGKRGLIKVISLAERKDGFIEIDLKIQK